MPQATFPTLGRLSTPTRMLFSAFLLTIGFGYIAALLWLYSADIKPHGTMGMNVVKGLEMKYHGTRGMTRLESMLNGAMADRVSPQQRAQIIHWIHDGATADGFVKVQPIFATACATCHSAKSGLPIPPLTDYQQVRKAVQFDDGDSFADLARVSHIHLFGISLIFVMTGLIFSLSQINAAAKSWILALPYAAIWADIGSWWLTKLAPVFAYVVLIGGALMGISLAMQILIPLWEMWVRPSSERVAGSQAELPDTD